MLIVLLRISNVIASALISMVALGGFEILDKTVEGSKYGYLLNAPFIIGFFYLGLPKTTFSAISCSSVNLYPILGLIKRLKLAYFTMLAVLILIFNLNLVFDALGLIEAIFINYLLVICFIQLQAPVREIAYAVKLGLYFEISDSLQKIGILIGLYLCNHSPVAATFLIVLLIAGAVVWGNFITRKINVEVCSRHGASQRNHLMPLSLSSSCNMLFQAFELGTYCGLPFILDESSVSFQGASLFIRLFLITTLVHRSYIDSVIYNLSANQRKQLSLGLFWSTINRVLGISTILSIIGIITTYLIVQYEIFGLLDYAKHIGKKFWTGLAIWTLSNILQHIYGTLLSSFISKKCLYFRVLFGATQAIIVLGGQIILISCGFMLGEIILISSLFYLVTTIGLVLLTREMIIEENS